MRGEPRRAFRYINRGTMATIGRNKAIAEFGDWHFSGFVAWLMWVFVHIVLLINFRSRFAVLSEWVWAYFTRERSARLIVGNAAQLVRVEKPSEKAIAENGTVSKMRMTAKS